MIVRADAERSCSRRRSVTDAACPSRVLIGPLMQPHFLFSARKGNGVARQGKRGLCETGSTSRAGIASEEGCSVPLQPGRRKFHIRSLLLSFQIVTVSLGHNLVLEDSAAPHAILMMADIWLFTDTLCKGGQGRPPLQRKKRPPSGGSDGVPLFIVLLFVSEAVSGANPCRRRSGRR